MKHIPSWEANSSSARQESPRIFWNPKVHYRIHKNPPPVLTWARSIQSTSPSHFSKFDFNIILPSMPWSSKWSLSIRSPLQNPVYTSALSHTCYFPGLSYSSWFGTWIIFRQQYRSQSSSLCSLLHSPVTSSLLGRNIFLSNLFSKILSLRPPPLNVR